MPWLRRSIAGLVLLAALLVYYSLGPRRGHGSQHASIDAIDVDGGLVLVDAPFDFELTALNNGATPWRVTHCLSSCGCLSVLSYATSVIPGDTLAVKIKVNPQGMTGIVEQRVRAYLSGRNPIIWKVRFVFGSDPFMVPNPVTVLLEATSDSFSVRSAIYAPSAPGAADLELLSATGPGDLSVTTGLASMTRGLEQIPVEIRGLLPTNARSGMWALEFTWRGRTDRVVSASLLVTRRAAVCVSPPVLYLCADRKPLTMLSYATDPGTIVETVYFEPYEAPFDIELAGSSLVLRRRAGKWSGHADLVLRLTSGTEVKIPVRELKCETVAANK